jgi:hypothetical protein
VLGVLQAAEQAAQLARKLLLLAVLHELGDPFLQYGEAFTVSLVGL